MQGPEGSLITWWPKDGFDPALNVRRRERRLNIARRVQGVWRPGALRATGFLEVAQCWDQGPE